MKGGRRSLAVILAAIAALGVLSSSCAADDPLAGPTTTRPPLSNPPDPGPPPLSDGLDSATRSRIIDSTVWVNGLACGRDREGSGFAVGPDLIATAAHVVAKTNDLTVTLANGRTLPAIPVLFDTVDDLALLRVADAAMTPLPLGDAADGTVGTLVGWESDPRPDPTPFRIDRPVTVRIREVGGTNTVDRPSWLLAAMVESGDSGAPLVDSSGVVVGIAYATTKRGAGVAYAVRATVLAEKLNGDLSIAAEVAECG